VVGDGIAAIDEPELTITAVEDATFILVAAAELTAAKEPKPWTRPVTFPLIGRVLIGLPFVMSGLGNLAAYGPTTAMTPPSAFLCRHWPSSWQ
jgi:hypothetical protein